MNDELDLLLPGVACIADNRDEIWYAICEKALCPGIGDRVVLILKHHVCSRVSHGDIFTNR